MDPLEVIRVDCGAPNRPCHSTNRAGRGRSGLPGRPDASDILYISWEKNRSILGQQGTLDNPLCRYPILDGRVWTVPGTVNKSTTSFHLPPFHLLTSYLLPISYSLYSHPLPYPFPTISLSYILLLHPISLPPSYPSLPTSPSTSTLMAVDCIAMASRHHPHHPSNYTCDYTYTPSTRRSSNSFSSNNPYARFSSPSPAPSYSRRPASIASYDSIQFPWAQEYHHQDRNYNRESHYDRERERKRSSTSSIPRRRSHRYPRTSQLVNPDIIDQLDDVTNYSYHHEGPYDAVRPERNRVSQHSPLEAVRESNEEALRATPHDKIIDCLNSHRPLDGVAYFPPGTTDRDGQLYSYEEGSNMMNDYGNFMRLPGQVSFLIYHHDFRSACD